MGLNQVYLLKSFCTLIRGPWSVTEVVKNLEFIDLFLFRFTGDQENVKEFVNSLSNLAASMGLMFQSQPLREEVASPRTPDYKKGKKRYLVWKLWIFFPFFLTAIMGCLRDYFSLFLSIYSSQQNLHLLFQFSIGTSYITFLLWLQIGFFYTIGYCSFYWSSIDFDPFLWKFFNRGQILYLSLPNFLLNIQI